MSAVPFPGTVLTFLQELRSTGAPVIRLRGQGDWRSALLLIETEAAHDPLILQLLATWHAEAARDLGGPPLPINESAALHGTRLLFRAAWCYLQRDTGKNEVTMLLQEESIAAPDPAWQFSADLALCYLPAVFRMAQALAPGDPLLTALRNLAFHYPLSGTAIPPENDIPAADLTAWENLQSHSGLQQLFLDRILITHARHWLNHPPTAQALHHTLGQYPQPFAPAFPRLPQSAGNQAP